MFKRQIVNARIERTSLGIEDHGILTAVLGLDYGGVGQGFGGYSLDNWSNEDGRRVGTAYGMEFVSRILKTVGVEKWEDLKGKHIRVDQEHNKIWGIGHIVNDVWFYPEKDLEYLIDQT